MSRKATICAIFAPKASGKIESFNTISCAFAAPFPDENTAHQVSALVALHAEVDEPADLVRWPAVEPVGDLIAWPGFPVSL